MAADIGIAIFSILGAAGFLLIAVSTGFFIWWFYTKRTSKVSPEDDYEPTKEKERLTDSVTKIRMYNQNEMIKSKEAALAKSREKRSHVKRVSNKTSITAGGDSNPGNHPENPATAKNVSDQANAMSRAGESDQNDAKTSTPVIETTPREKSRKHQKQHGGGTVSETGDTPLSCIEPLTGPFSEDKPYIVAYADLLTVGRGAPYPITEEASHVLSANQGDNSVDSSDFNVISKKPPRKPAFTTESSDDQDQGGAGQNKKEKRLQKIVSQTQKAVGNAKSAIARLTQTNTATIDESSSNSSEIEAGRHSKLSLGTPEANSVYYSEYSVTISPEVEVEPREIMSEPGGVSTAPRTGTPAPPNRVITHDRDSRGESQEEPEEDRPEMSHGGPSIDIDNSSTLQSKASRRSIVSVAFATCNESGQTHDEDHDGLTSATPDEPSRSASVDEDGDSEELSIVHPAVAKSDIDFKDGTPPASIVISDPSAPGAQSSIAHSIQVDPENPPEEMEDEGIKKEPLSKTPYSYVNAHNTSSGESEIAATKEDVIRQVFTTDTDGETGDRLHLMSSTRSVGGSEPFLKSAASESAPSLNTDDDRDHLSNKEGDSDTEH